MGEVNLLINEKPSIIQELKDNRERMENLIRDFFRRSNRIGLKKETIQLCNEIFSLDNRINPLDSLHIATAIVEKCRNFLFIDYEIANSPILNKFAKERGLNLINFAVPQNKDDRRPKKDFIMQE